MIRNIYIFLVSVLAAILLCMFFSKDYKYEGVIDSFEKERAAQKRVHDSLVGILNTYKSMDSSYVNTIDSLKWVDVKNKSRINELLKNNEKEIKRVDNLDSDAAFEFFTKFLENR